MKFVVIILYCIYTMAHALVVPHFWREVSQTGLHMMAKVEPERPVLIRSPLMTSKLMSGFLTVSRRFLGSHGIAW